MMEVSDNAIVTVEDIEQHLQCSSRVALEFIRNHGGSKIGKTWVILGDVLKAQLRPESGSGDSIKRRSLR